jgi:CheY-like chemotaxis protein
MKRGGTILLVDDDPDVREYTQFVLDEAGYAVRVAANGDEALRLLSGDPEIALLVTDVVMPGLNGVELARRARAMRPQLAFLFVTGYTRNIAPEALARASVLEKPFAPERLLHAVERALPAGATHPGRGGAFTVPSP